MSQDQDDRGMSDSKSVDQLANQYMRKVRGGESPSADELEEQFPDLSGDVGGLVKTLSILEEASVRQRRARPLGTVIDASGRRQRMLGGFRLIREISRGGMGIVYEAEQESLQRRVAVKVLPPSPLLTEVERSRFQREGVAVARLHHSNIVPVFGTGEQDGVQYCVMQYIEGYSLDRLVDALRARMGRETVETDEDPPAPSVEDVAIPSDAGVAGFTLSDAVNLILSDPANDAQEVSGVESSSPSVPSTAASPVSSLEVRKNGLPTSYWRNVARLMAEASDAIAHAHHLGVLHRDIKPGNLLFDWDRHAWVTDFGLAKLRDNDKLTATGSLIGTLRYTPPEQFRGKMDHRGDVYALGITLYELCTLEPAFSGSDRRELMHKVMTDSPMRPRGIDPDIPHDLETIILKAMSPEPENRYQSAADFSTDLHNYLEDQPLIARRQSPWHVGVRWCRRHRTESILGGFALTMLILFAVTASLAYVREAQMRRESEANAERTIEALDRVYNSYLPDWTTSATVSAHGSISVSPATARLLEELIEFYDDVAEREAYGSEKPAVLERANALRRVGLIYLRLGEFTKARASYSKAHEALYAYFTEHPSTDLRLERVRVLNELGAVYWTDRRFEESDRNHENAYQQLVTIPYDPEHDSALRFERARTLYLLGRRERELGGGLVQRAREPGDLAELHNPDSITKAAGILEGLTDLAPERLEFRHLLALCYRENAGRLLDAEGQPTDPAMQNALKELENVVSVAPEHPGYRYALCMTLQWCAPGDSPTQTTYDVAAKRLERSVGIAEELGKERPEEWIYAAAKVEGLIKLSNILALGNRRKEALAQAQQAIDHCRRLHAKYPDCELFRYWGSQALRYRGDLLREEGEYTKALRVYDLATTELQRWLRRSKVDTGVYKNLEQAWLGRAAALKGLGRDEEAKEARVSSEWYTRKLREGNENTRTEVED